MDNTKNFTLDLAKDLYFSDNDFPVDFDVAWQWLGYSEKSKGKRSLLNCGFVEGVDYQLAISGELRPQGGFTNREFISLTVDCLKHWAMMSGTEMGKKVRLYFLECEKIAKQASLAKQLPTDYLSALKALVVSEEEKQRLLKQKETLQNQLEETNNELLIEQKEHAKSAIKLDEAEDTLIAYRGLFSDDTNTLTFKQVADALGIPGYGRNNLFKFMRRKGGICTTSSEVRRSFIDRGYLISVPKQRTTPSGKLEPYNQAKFTIKGVAWLIKRLIESGETVKITAEQIWDNYQLNVNAMSDF
jgi:phage anti-repressor protein